MLVLLLILASLFNAIAHHRFDYWYTMNAVEIEAALSELALQPFAAQEFAYEFLAAFGHKETTLKRLRSGNMSMAITFDPLSAIKIDPPTIRFYSLFALIDSFHLQA